MSLLTALRLCLCSILPSALPFGGLYIFCRTHLEGGNLMKARPSLTAAKSVMSTPPCYPAIVVQPFSVLYHFSVSSLT